MTTANPDDGGWSDPSTSYIVSGTLAAPLLVFVLYTFCRFKRIRSHPAALMFARTIADTGFIISVLMLSAVIDNDAYDATTAESACNTFGPLIAFFFDASQFYFIGMCYDLYTTCTYPLRSVSYTANKIHIYSWLMSGLITIIFELSLPNSYKSISTAEVCFIGGINSNGNHIISLQEWFQFLGPYLIGVISGILSLIFVFFRLRNGLGDVFEHAHRMVKDHIIFVSLYTLLGCAWFILLLTELKQGGLSFAVSFIIVGTAAINCTTWILQKFRSSNIRNPLYRTTKLGEFLRKKTDLMGADADVINLTALHEYDSPPREQSMSSALRLELIRNMCSGVTQSLDHFKHNREYNVNNKSMDINEIEITALHFPQVATIKKLKKNSDLEKKSIQDQSIHRFLMASHSSGGSDQIDFIDFGPHVFRYLRNKVYNVNDNHHSNKIEEEEYIESIKIAIDNNSSMSDLSAKFSEGKSGAFFFMTPNNKYMVKTLRKSEGITFLKILPGYFEHMRKFPNTFITKFYGLFGIKLYGTRIYFTIMKNIFIANLEPHEKYDVKGSWINRHTKHHIELGKLMKDEDLKKNLLISKESSVKLWKQMSHDTRFLDTLNIMDYSLLLGIYYIGILSKNANLNGKNDNNDDNNMWNNNMWTLHTTPQQNMNTYNPPVSINDPLVHTPVGLNLQLSVNSPNSNSNSNSIKQHVHTQQDEEDEKQEILQEGDDDTGNTGDTGNNAYHNKVADDLEKNKDILSPRHKKQGTGVRRRAFTANTGLSELQIHPMSYQASIIEGPGFYIMGIIDILQEYNFNKKVERFLKVFIKCVDGYGISCIEPSMYRKRFLAKMLQIGIGRKSLDPSYVD